MAGIEFETFKLYYIIAQVQSGIKYYDVDAEL